MRRKFSAHSVTEGKIPAWSTMSENLKNGNFHSSETYILGTKFCKTPADFGHISAEV